MMWIYLTAEKKLDGVNQLRMLTHGERSARTEFVYNLNEVNGRAAIR